MGGERVGREREDNVVGVLNDAGEAVEWGHGGGHGGSAAMPHRAPLWRQGWRFSENPPVAFFLYTLFWNLYKTATLAN